MRAIHHLCHLRVERQGRQHLVQNGGRGAGGWAVIGRAKVDRTSQQGRPEVLLDHETWEAWKLGEGGVLCKGQDLNTPHSFSYGPLEG